MAKETKDGVFQLRVSADVLEQAKEVFAGENMTLSSGVRAFLEEVVRQGRMPFRAPLSASEQEKKDEMRVIERAVTQITGFDESGRVKTAEERLLDTIFGNGSSKDMDDDELRFWGASVGLPDGLSLTVLDELHDCGLFPDNIIYVENQEMRVGGKKDDLCDLENIRTNMAMIHMKMLAKALSAHLSE